MFSYTTLVSSSLRMSASFSEEKQTRPPAQMLLSSLRMLIVNSAEAVPYGPTGLCGCEGVGVECEVCGCEGMWHIMNRCIT